MINMLKVVLITILIFLSVIGLSEILHRLWLYLMRPAQLNNFLVTVLDDNYAAEQVHAILEDIRWNGKNNATLLIGIDNGLSKAQRDACAAIEIFSDDFIVASSETLWDEIIKRS